MKNFYFVIALPLAGMLFAVSACRKKIQPPAQPDLSAPNGAINSSSVPPSILPAEVQVKASSGPVELSLALYKKKIKKGDDPWFLVGLKNTGKNKIRVLSDAFVYPSVIQNKSDELNAGIYLEILDSTGKPPWPRRGSDIPANGKPPPSVLTANEHAKIDGWTKEGLSDEEIGRRAAQLLSGHPHAPAEPSAFWLEPDASTATAAWAYQDTVDPYNHGSRPRPVGVFAELSNYYLPVGKYRIRAVYDLSSNPSDYKKDHITPNEWDVLVRTPFVEFEVVP